MHYFKTDGAHFKSSKISKHLLFSPILWLAIIKKKDHGITYLKTNKDFVKGYLLLRIISACQFFIKK